MQYYTWRRQAERKPPCQRTIKPKNAYEFNIDGVSHVNWFKRKTSLWKHWEYRQGYKIGVLTCKSIQSP